jgi:hypothetical protein
MVAAVSWLAPSECRFVNLFPNHLCPASISAAQGDAYVGATGNQFSPPARQCDAIRSTGSVSKRSDQIRNPSALTTGCYFRASFLQRRSEHQACGRQKVMEWGFDGMLLNTAVSRALDPVRMAGAFAKAVRAGHSAFLGGPMTVQECCWCGRETGPAGRTARRSPR